MKNSLFRLCSIILVLVLLLNMLPLQAIAEQLQTGRTDAMDAIGSVETEENQSKEEIVSGQIIEEIVQNRTEFSKEFVLGNGLHMVTVYPDAVHYATEDGWEEIDNTLITKADGTITNTAGVWDVSFPQQLSKDKSITVKKDGYTLSFSMAGELTGSGNAAVMAAGLAQTAAQTLAVTNMQQSMATTRLPDLTAMRESVQYEEMVPEKLQSQISYENVYRNTDVIYDLNSNKVKESVILEAYNDALRGYRYTLDVGSMIPVLEEDGQILFYDASGENIVMVMPAPYMIDDAGVYNNDIQVQLTGSGSQYTMTYLLPQQWLAEEDRAWPVILDPMVQPSLDVSNIRDRSVSPYGSHSQTDVVNTCGYSTSDGITRFFLQYDNLPGLTSSDVIIHSTVTMHKLTGLNTETPVYVHKVLDTWKSENITWAGMPEIDENIEDYAIVGVNQGYVWDVTDIARGWYENENTGMMFKASDAVENGGVENITEFASSDHFEAYRPILSITFRNNNGLESYWDYTASSAGKAGTGYVNNYTGNLVWIREDIGFSGNRMPVTVSHVYNANDAQGSADPDDVLNSGSAYASNKTAGNGFGMGNGWRTNYNQLVYQWSSDSDYYDYYVWEDSDGTDHYFKYNDEAAKYEDEDGLELTLTTAGSGNSTYSITDKNGNASYFDTYGRLTKIENNQQTKSSIDIAYYGTSRRIQTITDGVGRKYTFTYDNDLLTKISYYGSGTTVLRYLRYAYEGNNLTSVSDDAYKETQYNIYTYGTNNLLTSAQDIDGYKLTYTYTAMADGKPARVSTVAESHGDAEGGMLTFEYQHNQTTVTDATGNVQILQFNNLGNTVCIQDDEGRAQYAQFANNGAVNTDGTAETGKHNQLTLSSKLQNTVGNMLDDSSFESGTLWSITANEPSVSIATSNSYHGSKSMQVVTSAYGSGVHENTYTIDAGETITFSAYVKTGSASLTISIFDWAGFSESETLTPNSDWTRLEASYTNNTSASKNICPHILTWTPGTFWVDGVQMETFSTASRYNLVENGDFRYSGSAWSSSAGLTTATSAAPQLQSTVYQITGSPTRQNRLTQTVYVSGVEGDSFVFAGWAKGNAAPFLENSNREFAIWLSFCYNDGTTSDPFSARFNPDSDQWQYVAAAAVAERAYSSVTIQLVYDYNVNTICFDGIQLYKEEFGTSYTYDDNGNVISTSDYANQNSQYNYSDNNLSKLISPTGTGYEYAYDDNNNLVLSRSSEGLQYEFTYDSYGNALEANLGANTYSTSITENKTYYIRNRLSGKYMDLTGNTIIQKTFSGADTQQWEVVQNRDGSLSLVNLSNAELGYFTASGGESANGTPVHIYMPYYESVNSSDFVLSAQGLRIQPATNHTYKILTKSGDYSTCVEVSNDSTADAAALVLWEYDESEAQQWYFEPADQQPPSTIEDGCIYQLRAFHSGRYVSVNNQSTENGSHLEQYRQEGLASQKFKLSKYGDSDYYTVTPENAQDKLVQISSEVNSDGYQYLQLGNNTVTDNKLFKFEYNADMQGFLIIPKANEAYSLAVASYGLTDGTQLIFTAKAANSNQVFIAEKFSDTITTSVTYSADGNHLASTTDTLGNVTTYSYNADTNVLEWVQYPEDTEETRTEYTYDRMYRLREVYRSLDTGHFFWVSYDYVGDDDLLDWIETASTRYVFTYGDFGHCSSIQVGSRKLADYRYDTDSGLHTISAITYGNEQGIDYTRDSQGRPMRSSYEDNDTTLYRYDNDGRLAETWESASDVTTRYYYDLTDRMVKYTQSDGSSSHSVVYNYNDVNHLTSLVEAINGVSHTTGYSYDDVNRVSSVSNGSVSRDYTYDALGRISQAVTKNGSTVVLTESYTYTAPAANATSTQIATYTTTAANGYTVTYSYTYDNNGNILSISDGTNTTSYVYDSANQLLRENNQAGGFTHVWEYNNAGNMFYREEYAYTTGSVEDLTPLDTVTYTCGDSSGWGDLLTAYDGQTITHDEIGNPLTDGTWTYTWEHGRELATMSDGTATWTYTYDTNGMRTQRTNGTKTYKYVYNGSSLSQMTVGNDTLYFAYDANGIPMSVTYNGTTYYYVTNIQGDVVAILNSSGTTTVVAYTYDAWGNILSTTGSMASTLGTLNPLRYRGYVYDTETELYYLQSRYYNPEMGRFINADAFVSTGQGPLGYNMFVYCGNNPVVRIDISGYGWKEIWGWVVDVYERATYLQEQQQMVNNQILSEQIEMARGTADAIWDAYMRGYNLQQEAQAKEAQMTLDGAKRIYEYYNENEELQQGASGGKRIITGFLNIRSGFAEILVPVPTIAEDLMGVAKITWGVIKVCYGIAEVISASLG